MPGLFNNRFRAMFLEDNGDRYMFVNFSDSEDFNLNFRHGALNGYLFVNRIISVEEALFYPLPSDLSCSHEINFFCKGVDSWKDSAISQTLSNLISGKRVSVEDILIEGKITKTIISIEDALLDHK